MRKLIIVSIAMNTLLLAGVVALAVMTGSIPRGEKGSSPTEKEVLKAAEDAARPAEVLVKGIAASYVADAKQATQLAVDEAKKAKTGAEMAAGKAEKAEIAIRASADEVKKAETSAKASAAEAKEAEKKAKESVNAAKKASEGTKEKMSDLMDSLIVPNTLKSYEYKASKVTGTFEPKIQNKGTLRIELPLDMDSKNLTSYFDRTRKTYNNRTKVILLYHNDFDSQCISKCGEGIFNTENTNASITRIDVPVVFFDTLDKITANTSVIVMFGRPDHPSWTYSKITIKIKEKQP